MFKKISNRLKLPLTRIFGTFEDQTIQGLDKIDESLTPNMRALRLVMTIADQLLTMGVPASDVVHMSLGITNTYCKRRVHVDVNSTLIIISQDRGINREPLTLVRTIVLDDANYQTIQSLQTLALDIRDKQVTLDDAELRVDAILEKPKSLNRLLIYSAGGAVSAGVVVIYDGSALMISLAFVMGFLITGLLLWFGRRGIATFHSQITAAL